MPFIFEVPVSGLTIEGVELGKRARAELIELLIAAVVGVKSEIADAKLETTTSFPIDLALPFSALF
jgi:hypothetical protein